LTKRPRKSAEFPEKSAVLEFIQESTSKVGKRENARAFGISGADDRMKLKKLIKTLSEEGAIERGQGRHVHAAGELPPVTVIEISEIDEDGELIARPAAWEPSDAEDTPPLIHVMKGRRGAKALAVGDRALARLKRLDIPSDDDDEDGRGPDRYEARVIKAFGGGEAEVVGLFQLVEGQGRIHPADRREKSDFVVSGPDSQGAAPGDVVLAEVLSGRSRGLKQARVREILGPMGAPATFSTIALKTHGIRNIFPDAVIKAAEAAKPPILDGRTDLRDIELITIDPVEARDHDDAVWAAADDDAANAGGWKIMVAIADVAAYVRPGTALDIEARERGNSTYFPDRVVPMLPEALSSGLCSLVPDEDRACLAVTMWLDAHGQMTRHKFGRGLMRSRARLSYGQTQDAIDGRPDEATTPLLKDILEPLYGAYAAIREAREKRQPLDLDLPELSVKLGDDGHVESVAPRARLDAHRLVEEFMILANVAAAEALEKQRTPCMYRIHDLPGEEKLSSLRDFLRTLDLKLSKGQIIKPAHFNTILAAVKDTPHEQLVNTVVLRSQSQAVYSPDNIGHFGLALRRYAHFTSPIRRYADLLVHRGLIEGLGLGDDGLPDDAVETFQETADHISTTERRSSTAEREANDRYLAAYMEDHVGATFHGRISGVARFGLFITLNDTGADGIVPVRNLGYEYFIHDEAAHALIGDASGTTYRLGDAVEVQIAEADSLSGSLRFDIVADLSLAPDKGQKRPGRGKGRRGGGSGGKPGGKSGGGRQRSGRPARKPRS